MGLYKVLHCGPGPLAPSLSDHTVGERSHRLVLGTVFTRLKHHVSLVSVVSCQLLGVCCSQQGAGEPPQAWAQGDVRGGGLQGSGLAFLSSQSTRRLLSLPVSVWGHSSRSLPSTRTEPRPRREPRAQERTQGPGENPGPGPRREPRARAAPSAGPPASTRVLV